MRKNRGGAKNAPAGYPGGRVCLLCVIAPHSDAKFLHNLLLPMESVLPYLYHSNRARSIPGRMTFSCILSGALILASAESVGKDAIFNCHSLPVVRAPSHLQATAEDWCWKLTEIEWY